MSSSSRCAKCNSTRHTIHTMTTTLHPHTSEEARPEEEERAELN